jgi:hypothetical protein
MLPRIQKRSRFSRRQPKRQLHDPPAMKTSRTTGPVDPPPTSTNITGVKRTRHDIHLAAGVGSLSWSAVGNCLPIDNATSELRIIKLSVWGPAAPGSDITVVFPISSAPTVYGDAQTWVDSGTQGSLRPAVHLTPNFNFRSTFVSASLATPFATFGGSIMSEDLIVDVTVEYRTNVQSCPALQHARSFFADVCDGASDGWCSRCRSYNCSCYDG